jgi:hypothetical protein
MHIKNIPSISRETVTLNEGHQRRAPPFVSFEHFGYRILAFVSSEPFSLYQHCNGPQAVYTL